MGLWKYWGNIGRNARHHCAENMISGLFDNVGVSVPAFYQIVTT